MVDVANHDNGDYRTLDKYYICAQKYKGALQDTCTQNTCAPNQLHVRPTSYMYTSYMYTSYMCAPMYAPRTKIQVTKLIHKSSDYNVNIFVRALSMS